MENVEVQSLINNIEKEQAQRKIGYWQTAGKVLLDNEELGEKWCAFVDEKANDDFVRGALLDETLEIMTMLKSNIPIERIASIIQILDNYRTILDDYLKDFVRPEILDDIRHTINEQKDYSNTRVGSLL